MLRLLQQPPRLSYVRLPVVKLAIEKEKGGVRFKHYGALELV
jgi:hypothetical protein